jgi:predicted AAA+ superfamily ATPase
MAGVRAPLQNREPPVRFFDDEERELIESFEEALERGGLPPSDKEELDRAKLEWRAIALASKINEAVSRAVQDPEILKLIARRRPIPYQNAVWFGSAAIRTARAARNHLTVRAVSRSRRA